MARKFRLVLILGLVLMVTALAGLVVFRTLLAQTLIEVALRARGIPAPRLTVAAIDLAGHLDDGGRQSEACEILSAATGRFRPDDDTADLRLARSLLDRFA